MAARRPPAPASMPTPPETVDALLQGRHGDPFAVLGLHDRQGGGFVARAIVPGAESVDALTLSGEPLGALERTRGDFFEGAVAAPSRQPLKLRARRGGEVWEVVDPYSFGPVLGPVDDYLIGEGSHARLFDKFGAHLIAHEGAEGTHFAVWAPNARRVSVVGDWNHWDGRTHVMRHRAGTGVWEVFLPGVGEWASYKYEVVASDGTVLPQKADPFGFASELRPATASKVAPSPAHRWEDGPHRRFWAAVDPRRVPISIYEVHAGSWRRREDGGFLTWDELAAQLIPYVADMGFTHIEFLPVSEYPYDPSWGYQPVGLFAPTARFGDPEGFARLVDGCHRAGIGVLVDWVPAHFPSDAHGLSRFDGTALYEHEDPRLGYHPDWNTLIYNFGRREVSSFLVNNALFWAERYHVDGLRVDAVASMLYLDYSRKDGEWIPNRYGGRENLEAVDFLRRMNTEVYREHPAIMTIAEESTSWPGVSKPVHEGGLGFGFKWNMGFMHDTLQYMSREPIHRRFHHHDMTFGLVYAFAENFVLPLSHDEVVHGKGSLLAKMAGDDWQQFASLRAYFGFMWGYPGKKLLFMGGEFAQRREWSEARALDWDLLQAPSHEGVRQFVRDLNALYRHRPALHARDCEGEGFEWAIVDDNQNSVFAWIRRAPGAKPVAIVCNFTPVPRHGYRVPLPVEGHWREILNSDAASYGGSGQGNFGEVTCENGTAAMTLPPLSCLMLEPEQG